MKTVLCRVLVAAACALPIGCGAPPLSSSGTFERVAGSPVKSHAGVVRSTSPIEHIVIIIQENRSVDNLFQLLPGANTQSWGYNTLGQRVPLVRERLTAPYGLGHTHKNWLTEYNDGGMNGWNLEASACSGPCPPKGQRAYAYVPQHEVQPYYTMAETYTFADNMFETNQGPSFPAHQYFISGTSTISNGSDLRASENPRTPTGGPTGGCDSPPGSLVTLIDESGNENQTTYPCFERNSIMAELNAARVSWRYYQAAPGAGFWKAVDAIEPIWQNRSEYAARVLYPSSQVLTDIANDRLASVVWVTPTVAASDHAGDTDGSGPSWVTSVVNAIGESRYWNSTAILITWDDWGGWFDHVTPTVRNSYELSFRIPLIVISPYAKTSYVSHVAYEDGSILKFVEETFDLPSLGTTDKDANDLSDCFNWSQSPTPYTPIVGVLPPAFFYNDPTAYAGIPDND
jgi:phospholipase C